MASIQRTVDKSDRVPEFFDLDSMEVDGQNLIFHLNRAKRKHGRKPCRPIIPDRRYKRR